MHSGKHSGAVDSGQTLKNTFLSFSSMHPKQFALGLRVCVRPSLLCSAPHLVQDQLHNCTTGNSGNRKFPAAPCPTVAQGAGSPPLPAGCHSANAFTAPPPPACGAHEALCRQDVSFPWVQFLGLAPLFLPRVADTGRCRLFAVSTSPRRLRCDPCPGARSLQDTAAQRGPWAPRDADLTCDVCIKHHVSSSSC